MAGKKKYHDSSHDGIIGISGGSGMDGGKAISLIANNDYDIIYMNWEDTKTSVLAM